ncbi:N-acetyltransferase [Halalkalibacillus sediminis]|uniref:N-acetyltransferase n=1 Tax=Halalkalibacillus sediminis TaxID=2018042 RepID=A0A2I0QUL5_9BACI|nr:GNAT family N-acetyltransferase [Halalkalibacillus sediminis]PKR78042.1 N-acetyltransferase [Halalkalibacillus sediminis]
MIDTIKIRQLNIDDESNLASMDTGIEDDYVVRIFQRLIEHQEHALYGLFIDEQIVAVAGYSVFAEQYAMLGRWRSDRRYYGKGHATRLIQHTIDEVEKLPGIHWVGANTQVNNHPALRVLEKVQLPPLKKLHASTLMNPDDIARNPEAKWTQVKTLKEKRAWIKHVAGDQSTIFPYECYYPFPSSDTLFTDEKLEEWYFFENSSRNRVLIVSEDQKKYHYAHAVYLWDDSFEQPGLWDTLLDVYDHIRKKNDEETYVWIDLTDEEKSNIPTNFDFHFQDAWILHGKWL